MTEANPPLRVFVGGATGATGRATVEACVAEAIDVVPHVRPQSVHKWDLSVEPAVFELDDESALDAAMRGCTSVVCAIGTMRNRFAAGDTYESSDIAATRQLVEAAQRLEISRFALISALGASWAPGAYYQAKRKAEALVTDSGLDALLLRPSALSGNGRRVPPGSGAVGFLGAVPGLRGWADDVKPIDVNVIGRALCIWVQQGANERVWMGRDLWTHGARK